MALGAFAALFNFIFWRLLIMFQNRDVRSGLIPPRGGWNELHTGRIPHLQDYWTNGFFGDVVAFSLIDFAVTTAVSHESAEKWMLLSLPVGVIAAFVFYKMATLPARASLAIDWWFVPSFVEGRLGIQVTTAGKLHLLYFGTQSAVAFIGAKLLFSGGMTSLEAVVGLMGGLLYGVAFAMDKYQKHI